MLGLILTYTYNSNLCGIDTLCIIESCMWKNQTKHICDHSYQKGTLRIPLTRLRFLTSYWRTNSSFKMTPCWWNLKGYFWRYRSKCNFYSYYFHNIFANSFWLYLHTSCADRNTFDIMHHILSSLHRCWAENRPQFS